MVLLENGKKGFLMKKRILGVALAVSIIAILFSVLPVMAAEIRFPSHYLGDANGDCVVDVQDVIYIRQFMSGGYGTQVKEKSADVNEDGKINAQDLVTVRRYVVGGYGVELEEICYDSSKFEVVVPDSWNEDLLTDADEVKDVIHLYEGDVFELIDPKEFNFSTFDPDIFTDFVKDKLSPDDVEFDYVLSVDEDGYIIEHEKTQD